MDSVYGLIALSIASLLVVRSFLNYISPQLPANTQRPPRPSTKPLIGNVADIPPFHSWLKFKEWSDKLGPIFRFSVFGTQHYVVSTEKIANDLLRDRGAIHSSREALPTAAVLLGNNEIPLFLPVDPANPKTQTWRNGRKFYHQVLGPSVVESYAATHEIESVRLIYDLIREPAEYEKWVERFSAGVVFRLVFGKHVETGEEFYVTESLRALRVTEKAASPGAYLVDVFPSMMRLPAFIAPWKRYLLKEGRKADEFFKTLQDEVRQDMRIKKAHPSFTRTFLESINQTGLDDIEGAYLLGTLYGAGAGTTSGTLLSFILTMVLHPKWQARVQHEVEKIVGDERLPDFEDLPNLPTVRAVVKEVMRWRTITAGGIPHKSVKDDVYEGYFIPAGTNIHPNLWAIHREENLYPDPNSFRPDRWLSPDFPTYREPLTKYPNLQNFSAFGFGRRICPGQYLAERSLNISIARLVWTCEFGKKIGSDGKEIEVPLYDYTIGFNAQPKPFQFDVKVRSTLKTEVIQAALKRARDNDPLMAK